MCGCFGLSHWLGGATDMQCPLARDAKHPALWRLVPHSKKIVISTIPKVFPLRNITLDLVITNNCINSRISVSSILFFDPHVFLYLHSSNSLTWLQTEIHWPYHFSLIITTFFSIVLSLPFSWSKYSMFCHCHFLTYVLKSAHLSLCHIHMEKIHAYFVLNLYPLFFWTQAAECL